MQLTWMFLFVHDNNTAVGKHHFDFHDVVNAETMESAQKSESCQDQN